MGSVEFDCIVVGARCAGAPLATHLARKGMRVCVVDAAKLPSDQPFSTHAIQPRGIDYLDELGVGDKVRAVSTPIAVNRFVLGESIVDLPARPGRPLYCPRRSTLDPLLVEAAVGAGAELRDETAVIDVLREDARVVGVRVQHQGRESELRARIVVGADGRNSTVAKRVGAVEYHPVESPRGGYWGYFPVTPEVERLGFQAYIEINHTHARFFFRSDGGLVVAGALAPTAVARGWARDIDRSLREGLMGSRVTRLVVESGQGPVAPPVGLMKVSSFFRVPVGPGWALVGDAGLHKDPTPGYGITDALRDAKALASAILDEREAALEVYWRQRDMDSLPRYAHATALGSLEYHNPLNELIVRKFGATPELVLRLQKDLERELSPFEVVSGGQVLGWMAGAFVRGQRGLWEPFVRAGKRGAWLSREMSQRAALLRAAKRRLESDGPARARAANESQNSDALTA